jgi:hypothetical protein
MIYTQVIYEKNEYAVININDNYPAIIDYKYLKAINNLKKEWKTNKNGFIYCKHNLDDKIRDIYIHELVMALSDDNKNESIIHLNRLGQDNRKSNLIYECKNEINKSFKKRKRIINLPKDCGIDPDSLPTFVWYMKPNKNHGDRFMVSIGNIKWKTTSKKDISLKYKLEEAKKYIRQLQKENPILFEKYSMNGDHTKNNEKLLLEYYNIIHLAKYGFINANIIHNSINILTQNKEYDEQIKKKFIKPINGSDMPKYCHYVKKNIKRGDYFIIKNHPKIKKWLSTSSKKITIQEKYDKMIKKLDENM